jgi:predicted transcriptional regulator
MKVQDLAELEAEMRAVARGEQPAPRDAGQPSAESAEALLRLLTPDNRRLMQIIRDEKPQSVAELSRMTKRAVPNLLRSLAKLEAFQLVQMKTVDRRKMPVSTVTSVHIDIDPYTVADRVELRHAGTSRSTAQTGGAMRPAKVGHRA